MYIFVSMHTYMSVIFRFTDILAITFNIFRAVSQSLSNVFSFEWLSLGVTYPVKSEVQTRQPVEMIEHILFLFSESCVVARVLSKLIFFSREFFFNKFKYFS